ncbi:sensor histidine kinase [uncultured Alsobacter sp.]|uniref:sensor histidine kinase n=1 Tax=uncultured Alsobacter sp. TaxID=1748258 RepID=UPI0025D51845|nr:sensor histidine kinase [uncultured Alsobacter sp.]
MSAPVPWPAMRIDRWLAAALCLVAAWCLFAGAAPAAVPSATVAQEVVVLPVETRNDILFRRTRLEDGLSQTRVSHIVQDDRGFLWFGTQHGLNRYDGRSYRLFKHEAGDPGSLSGVFIYALFKDRDGTLWVGSDQGLDAYDPRTEAFRHVRLDDGNPVVNHVSQDEDGVLWLATVQGLYRHDPRTGAVTRFLHDPVDDASLASNDVKSSGLDRQGRFWVATGEGLETFDRATGRVTFRIPIREAVREFYFHEDKAGTFWIVYGSGNGLAQFDRTSNTLTRFAVQGGSAGGSGLTGVYAILEDHEGTIWLGTMGEGLLRYDRQRHAFRAYRHDPGSLESLAENRIIALFEDTQQNVWVGLHASPPNSFAASELPFKRVATPVADPKSVGETLVNTVYTDAAGILWAGAGGALGRIDRKSGESRPVALPGEGAVEMLAIRENPAGVLWAGSLGRGLFRLDLASGATTHYRHDPADPASIGSDIVTRIFVARGGAMWLATWNGLNRFDPATGRAQVFKRDPQSAAEGYFSIAEDPSGDLWLGSTAGLYRFEPGTGRFAGFRHDPSVRSTLSNNTVNTVLVDGRGALWVGTQNGLNLLDRAQGTFKVFGKADGLPGDVVSCILEERPGTLWMSTNNGIARLQVDTMAFTAFSIADGLPGNDLSGWNACHRAPSGEMVFGGFSGATVFDPAQAMRGEVEPPLVLTDVRLSGRPVTAAERTRLEGGGTARLEVPSDGNEFAIAFAALCFRNPNAVQYRYRLQGLDTGWHEGGSDLRLASYTAVPAGTYRFEVQARTGRSGWSAPGQALTITVLPPWWERGWVKLVALGLLFAASATAYRMRLAQIGRHYAMRLDERVNERTRIAREIHDSLLQGFQGLVLRLQAVRNMLPARPQEAADMLDLALDRADQAIGEGRDTVSDLRAMADGERDLPAALASLRDEVAGTAAGAAISFLIEGRTRHVTPLLVDEVFLVAREAVRNAAQHAAAAHIEVELSYGRKLLVLRVRDDGVGLDAKVAASGRREGHWGLAGMHERAERIGGRLTVWSQPGAGTEIELVIPAAAAYGGAGWVRPVDSEKARTHVG